MLSGNWDLTSDTTERSEASDKTVARLVFSNMEYTKPEFF